MHSVKRIHKSCRHLKVHKSLMQEHIFNYKFMGNGKLTYQLMKTKKNKWCFSEYMSANFTET